MSGSPTLQVFADEVGSDGAVRCFGGRTHVGPSPRVETSDVREVRAPAGVVHHDPAELIVRVRAGTPVAELEAVVAAAGQEVPLDPAEPERATVGGVLAAAASGHRRLRFGPVRDLLLEATFVDAHGRLARAGGPVVKNVTGFDVCRLLVGSHGTLGLLAEVVLRCHPRPQRSAWFVAQGVDPFDVRRRLHRPAAVLWDGTTTWVLLEGHADDVAAERATMAGVGDWLEAGAGPALPQGGRLSMRPSELRGLAAAAPAGAQRWVAEVGVGTVHVDAAPPPRPADAAVARLCERVKAAFDPTGRFAPGVRPW